MTPSGLIQVMISSARGALDPFRELMADVINEHPMMKAVRMETEVALPDDEAIAFSYNMVNKSGLYILLLGSRYGYMPTDPRNPSGLSMTHLEYLKAKDNGTPTYVFMQREVNPDIAEIRSGAAQKLLNWRDELQTSRFVNLFDDKVELERELRRVLNQFATNHAAKAAKPTEEPSPYPAPPNLFSKPPYVMTNTFVGRAADLAWMDGWAQGGKSVMVIEAMGGLGKSALAWHWVNHHAPKFFPGWGVVWWSFYERGATLEALVTDALSYLTRKHPRAFQSMTARERTDLLLDELEKSPTLLVLDGLERALVAYAGLGSAYLRDDSIPDDADSRQCIDRQDAYLLQRLCALRNSRVLVASRLMPRDFEQYDMPKPGVRQFSLRGFTSDDAYALMLSLGVRRADRTNLDIFLAKIDFHPLFIKLIAGEIQRYNAAPGDFDRWLAARGHRLDFTKYSIEERDEKTLDFLFEMLNTPERILLGKIAAYGRPISYDEMLALNPDMPPRPPLPPLPPLPQVRPFPFGSLEAIRLRRAIEFAENDEERDGFEARLREQEAKDEADRQRMIQNREALDEQARSVRARRKQILARCEEDYRSTDEYQHACERFDTIIQRLEGLGLLDWDRSTNIYDLHPLIRSHALRFLDDDTKNATFAQIIQTLSTAPRPRLDQLDDVMLLQNQIDQYRVYMLQGQNDMASNLYIRYLLTALRRLGANRTIIGMLTPMFKGRFDRMPKVVNAPILAVELGRAFHRMGDADTAQELFRLTMDPSDEGNAFSMSISVTSYAEVSVDMNNLYTADRAYRLSGDIMPHDNVAWFYDDMLRFNLTLGDLEAARSYADRGLDSDLPDHNPRLWQGRFNLNLARMYLMTGELEKGDVALREAEELARALLDRRYDESVAILKGEYATARGDLDAAEEHFLNARSIAQPTGQSTARENVALAMIAAERGETEAAHHALHDALNDPRLTLLEKTTIYFRAAQVYQRLGDTEQAKDLAWQVYNLACADGTPYVRRRELDGAADLLRELGEDPAPPPPLDESMHEPLLPFEEEIRQKFPPSDISDGKSTGGGEQFYIRGRDWFQIGTIASFGLGLELTDLSRAIVHKLLALSDITVPYAVSEMGQEPAMPDSYETTLHRAAAEDLVWSYDEEQVLDKVFVIALMLTTDGDGEDAFCYVNVRGDRLQALLEKTRSGDLFRLKDYATVVRIGKGIPSPADRRALHADFLFREDFASVRLFPPLGEVTGNNGSRTTEEQPGLYIVGSVGFRLGTVACFGMGLETDPVDPTVRSIAEKLASLNNPTVPVVYSKVGSDITPPSVLTTDLTHKSWYDLLWTAKETPFMSRVFNILLVRSHDRDGQPVYALINIRLDRFEALMNKLAENKPFRLEDFATLILHGAGDPTDADRKRMEDEYLFVERYVNVRLFNPLD